MKLFNKYQSGSWVSGISNGHYFQAKIYDTGSKFGINEGRVSKLQINKDENSTKFSESIYNFDRGLDFDTLPEGLLELILADLEGIK